MNKDAILPKLEDYYELLPKLRMRTYLDTSIRDSSSLGILEPWQTLARYDRSIAHEDGETPSVGTTLIGDTGVRLLT